MAGVFYLCSNLDALELIHPLAAGYAARFTSAATPLLTAIEAETVAVHLEPHMLSGQLQGQFLEMISKMVLPRRILEIGTMVGYSTICLAQGLAAGGRIHTIELREADAAIASANFEKAGISKLVQLHVGDARLLLPQLEEAWDLVFIDADKTGYLEYYELVLPRLRPGAILIADNVLFHGAVLEEPLKGKNAKAVHAFSERVKEDTRVEHVLLTIRDGLMIIRKK